MDKFDFDINKHMNMMEEMFGLSKEDKDKIYTFFKWNLKSLNKRETKESFQETVFRTTIMTYISTRDKK